MGFIASGNILVFPCGRRSSDYDITARLTTEYNLVSIINRLVDKESFIVTDVDFSRGIAISNANLFSFNIGGYLFTTTPKDVFNAAGVKNNDTSTKVYAYINKNTLALNDYGSINQELIELKAIDPEDAASLEGATFLDIGATNSSEFVGVNFVKSRPSSTNNYIILPLFEKRDDGWYFVEDSKIKFETNTTGTHRSVKIDDGILG